MPDPIIDREALIEAAAKAGYELGSDRTWAEYARRSPVWADGDMDTAATMLPVIAAAILAPLRELADSFRDSIDWSDGRNNYGDNEAYEQCARDLSQALDAIEAAVKGGE